MKNISVHHVAQEIKKENFFSDFKRVGGACWTLNKRMPVKLIQEKYKTFQLHPKMEFFIKFRVQALDKMNWG